MIDVEDVRRTALNLPGSYEQASFEGQLSWRTKPRMVAWLWVEAWRESPRPPE